MTDAEAICEAETRPTMRSAPITNEETQAAAIVFRICEFLITYLTHAKNALRGHMAAFVQIVAQGTIRAFRLNTILEDPDSALHVDAFVTQEDLATAPSNLETEIRKANGQIAWCADRVCRGALAVTVTRIGSLIVTTVVVLGHRPKRSARRAFLQFCMASVPRQRSACRKQKLRFTVR